jgi:hypothetical protein
VDRGQAQSATTTSKRQMAANTFDQYSHEATPAMGLFMPIAVK